MNFASLYVSFHIHFIFVVEYMFVCVSLVPLYSTVFDRSLSPFAKYLFYFLVFHRFPHTHTQTPFHPDTKCFHFESCLCRPFFIHNDFLTHIHIHSIDFDYYLLRFGFDLWQFTITKVVTYNNIFARKLSLLLLLLLLVLLLHVYLGSLAKVQKQWSMCVCFFFFSSADSLWIVRLLDL